MLKAAPLLEKEKMVVSPNPAHTAFTVKGAWTGGNLTLQDLSGTTQQRRRLLGDSAKIPPQLLFFGADNIRRGIAGPTQLYRQGLG